MEGISVSAVYFEDPEQTELCFQKILKMIANGKHAQKHLIQPCTIALDPKQCKVDWGYMKTATWKFTLYIKVQNRKTNEMKNLYVTLDCKFFQFQKCCPVKIT